MTRQTNELTLAFEKQTQHIAGLLAELREKESALFRQNEELMRYKQELDVLKKERKEEMEEKQRDNELRETSQLQPEQENKCFVTFNTADPSADLNVQTSQPKFETCDADTSGPEVDSEAGTAGKKQPVSVDLNKSESCHESNCEVAEDHCSQNEGREAVLTEVMVLRRENQQLKQKLEDLRVSDTRNPTLQTESENQDASVKQSQSSALSRLEEQETKRDNKTEEVQENVKKNENEGQDSERDERRTMKCANDQEEASKIQVSYLQQQVNKLN